MLKWAMTWLTCTGALQDVSVLQYGVQQQVTLAELHARDRHNFDPEHPFQPTGSETPEPFSGVRGHGLTCTVWA